MSTILDINDLSVRFSLADSAIFAVRDLSLSLEKGETLGLVGESGCGKSVTAYSILRLVSPPGEIVSGRIFYDARDILSINEGEMRKIRGREISIIFQEPMTSLNPVFKIGFQISETVKLHLKKNGNEAKELSIDLLRQVGIPDPEKRYNSYPHELSGGMRQRVMIAIALSAYPSILIADEPTTALDVTVQAQILDLLLRIQKEKDMTLLVISHDLGVVANVADKIAIMYAGEIVEYGSVKDIFNNPLHPYTLGLFQAIPKIGEDRKRLTTIPGIVPTITNRPQGCVFHPRCPKSADECMEDAVPLIEKGERHQVRCIRI
ncbi:MAG: ABC transporter ATP-binding protein [Spirochaetota bacterium]|nr:ABC transporter ATP-binding protein [Spirochaetota bacterium]